MRASAGRRGYRKKARPSCPQGMYRPEMRSKSGKEKWKTLGRRFKSRKKRSAKRNWIWKSHHCKKVKVDEAGIPRSPCVLLRFSHLGIFHRDENGTVSAAACNLSKVNPTRYVTCSISQCRRRQCSNSPRSTRERSNQERSRSRNRLGRGAEKVSGPYLRALGSRSV